MRSPRLPLLLVFAYAGLSAAWVLGNPVGGAPDETGHYVKALAVGAGKPTGRAVDFPPSPGDSLELAWVKRTTRLVDVPSGLSAAGLECHAGRPDVSARCQEAARPPTGSSEALTHLGTHQPLLYVLPGVAARTADDPVTAIRLGRAVNATVSVGLVALAVALLWESGSRGFSVVGLVVAVTPMAVFLASSLTTSGPEVAAGVCFFAALLRLGRGPAPPPWTWAAAGASGSVLALTRSLGPLWLAVALLVFVVACGRRCTARLVGAGGRKALLAAVALVVAAGAGLAWEVTVQPHGDIDAARLAGALRIAVDELPEMLRHEIGVFGSLDARMPRFAYMCWNVMVVALVVMALLVGRRRERTVLLLLVAGSVLVTIVVSVLNRVQTGFGMQGRYVLPLVVAVPLYAGETLFRGRDRLGAARADRLVVWLTGPAAAVHVVGWYANARRSAVGVDGALLFMSRGEAWRPGIGWYPLLALVLVSALAMAVFALRASSDQARPADDER